MKKNECHYPEDPERCGECEDFLVKGRCRMRVDSQKNRGDMNERNKSNQTDIRSCY